MVAGLLTVACLWSAGVRHAAAAETAPAAESLTDAIKNIPFGPGKLDFGFNLRTRFEWFDNFFTSGFVERTRNNKPALDASDANWFFAQLTFKF
jgi:hypothetical protein